MTDSIEEITKEIRRDPMNAVFEAEGQKPLFSAPEESRILIIGQAPGAKAMEKGVYWDDQSGDRLRDFMGVDRDFFYNSHKLAIVPMDFYFRGKGKSGDLPPRMEFAKKWHQRIISLCPEIRLTILIGSYAQKYYLNTEDNLTETVKHYKDYLPQYFPIVHPSPRNQIWMKKNPWFAEEVLPGLKDEVRNAVK